MLSFHNKASVKAKYVNRVLAHQKADRITQGTGWDGSRGCAVGCTLEVYKHDRYPIELGLPIWLAHLEDGIFEGLSQKEALVWPAKFLKAIPIGVTDKGFNKLYHQQALIRQKRNLKAQQNSFKRKKTEYSDEVIGAIKKVIAYHKIALKPKSAELAWSAGSAAWSAWSAAESAKSAKSAELAWSAGSAAWSAWSAAELAKSAELAWSAWSAAWSARSAAWSARSATESARSAKSAAWSAESAKSATESAKSATESAKSAFYKQEAEDLLKLLKQL